MLALLPARKNERKQLNWGVAAICLCLILLLCMMVFVLAAEGEAALTCACGSTYENGICPNAACTAPYQQPVGNGTVGKPYEIANAGNLYWFAAQVNGGRTDINAKLVSDITVNPGTFNAEGSYTPAASEPTDAVPRVWTPIGSQDYKYYVGSFDGDGHTISGLYAHDSTVQYVGLFGYVAGGVEIKNVTVQKSYLLGKKYVGGVIGYASADDAAMTVTNCSNLAVICGDQMIGGVIGYISASGNGSYAISGCTNSGTVCCTSDSSQNIGGVVGYAYYYSRGNSVVTLKACTNSGTVKGGSAKYVGGIVGRVETTYGTFTAEDHVNSGEIAGKGYVGGVIGRAQSGSGGTVTVKRCTNSGDVAGPAEYVAGIVGYAAANFGTVSVENSASSGNVTGGAMVGGVVGYAAASNSGGMLVTNCYNTGSIQATKEATTLLPRVGGVVGMVLLNGDEKFAMVTCCYNIGAVTGVDTTYVGGVAGGNQGGVVRYCYYLTDTASSGIGSHNDGEADAKSAETFASGEVTYLLNRGKVDGTLVWKQTIGTNAYPGYTGGTVYLKCATACNESTVSYTNDASDQKPLHVYSDNGFCEGCDASEPCETDENGAYRIENAGQLYWFAAKVNEGNREINGRLAANIVVNPGKFDENGNYTPAKSETDGTTPRAWTPIGSDYTHSYKGVFNGNGYTISGLYLDTTKNYIALFGYISGATIKNVGVIDSYFKAGNYTAGIVGYVYSGTVETCYNASTIRGERYVGGIAGSVGAQKSGSSIKTSCYITNCFNTGSVSGTKASIGGIVGWLKSKEVKNCYNIGSVSSADGDTTCGYVGAVVGGADDDAIVSNCHYLSGCAQNEHGKEQGGIGGSSDTGAELDAVGKTESQSKDEFASGKVTYLLNENSSDGVWKQTIGTDAYPSFTGLTVYLLGELYSNEDHTHAYESGICSSCGGYEKPSGEGTTDSRYLIGNLGNLLWFAERVNSGNTGIAARLTATIDATSKADLHIGTKDNPYGGNFAGNGYELKIAITSGEDCAAPFAYVNGAIIHRLTVSGTIDTAAEFVGGIIGRVIGGKTQLVNCTSLVTVNSTSNGSSAYVGGLVGSVSVDAANTLYIKSCRSTADVTASAKNAYAGGLLGSITLSSSDAQLYVIDCCATGKVTAAATEFDAFAGGLVGYANVQAGTISVTNCYAIGTVSASTDGDTTAEFPAFAYQGGVVGYTIANAEASGTIAVTNCYYLQVDGLNGIGNTADAIGAVEAKTAAQFASGEVTYLLNGSTSEGTQVVPLSWYQTIGAGGDSYPTLDSTHGIVYLHGTAYSNSATLDIVSVTITWTSMEFTYTDGAWQPDTHSYGEGTWSAGEGNGTITVENTGNVTVTVSFAYTTDRTDVSGSFDKSSFDLAANASDTTKLTLSGKPSTDLNHVSIGRITITITKKSE